MNDSVAVLDKAVKTQQTGDTERPKPQDLVAALQATEKSTQSSYTLSDLVGIWRLSFITGTKKTRQKAGVALGAGRYLPKLLKIQLVYESFNDEQGSVQNSVALGAMQFTLTGPVRFWPKARCLAFDFTQFQIFVGTLTLYQGRIKSETASQDFYQQPLKDQAFFKYFWVSEQGIAARGRGGGLALWSREEI
ncbi:MAG: hypothetical protein AAGA83_11355 [Cyanobacteria bacterium P01_F01_bin.116]